MLCLIMSQLKLCPTFHCSHLFGSRYLAGVLGFTEELNRYALQRATHRDQAAVQRCRDVVEALMGQFLQVGSCISRIKAFRINGH